MFNPLAEYLSKEAGEKVTLLIPKDFDQFKEMVKANQVDIGFANSLVYVDLKKNTAIDPLAVAVEKKGGAKFRGIMIVRKDSGIDSLGKLKGKKIIFVDKSSVVYLTGMSLLKKSGYKVDTDFTVLPFAKTVSNVAMAVFNKSANAGVIREDDLEKMKDKINLEEIAILAYTDYTPNWPVFSTSKLSKNAASKISAALLKLKPALEESKKVLGKAELSGFDPVTDKDYDQLRHAANNLH
jgi:phosphate/phosphite/phosphonate ABC transporter binding protein